MRSDIGLTQLTNKTMLYIENSGVRVGVLEDVGGRIVLLQKNGGKNLLESDESMWDEPQNERFVPSPDLLDFKAYNGHEVWVGPQSQWWKHQTLNKEKIDSDLFWPPDPFISFNKYSVISHSANKLVIEGEGSPISGIKFKKSIEINNDGKVLFEVEATNIRDEEISWDLWLLTRINGHCPAFVQIADKADVHVSEPTHPHQGEAPYRINNGCFYFVPKEKSDKFEECTAKAFIKPEKPVIAALVDSDKFLAIRFQKEDPSNIHPEQAEVEIYSFATDKSETSLIELEYHAPFKTLKPGESMKADEIWEILHYSGECNEDDLCDFFLKSI